jgi:hypothetical protein
VTIELTSALDSTVTHLVEVTADERMLSCTGSGPRLPVTCSPGLSLSGMGVENRTADAVMLSPPLAFDRVSIEGTPQQIELTITSDAATKSGVLAPTYKDEELNGPGCGTCRTGVARFDNR